MNESMVVGDTALPSKPEPYERFCFVLANIPVGFVCSYGELARLAELGGARHSCRLLKKLPSDSSLPWFRIVNAQGKLADFGGAERQRRLLADEGIRFTESGRIPKRYFIDGSM